MAAVIAWVLGHPIELLTLALVITTIYYAWQTRHMVREMAAARAESIKPAVRLDFGLLAPEHVHLVLENVGGGPAMGLNLSLTLSGFSKGDDVETLSVPLLRVGERQKLFYPTWGGKELMQLKSLREVPVVIRLTGTCTDVEGRPYDVLDVLDFGLQTADAVPQLPWYLDVSSDHAAVDRLAKEIAKLSTAVQMSGKG